MKKIRPFLIGAFILALSFLSSCDMLGNLISSSSLISSNSSTSTLSSSSSSSSVSSSSHEHSWDTGTIAKKATCKEDGEMTYNCTSCEETRVEIIKATGHAEVIDVAIKPTCTETGLTEGKHCSTCNDILVKQEVIPALGHTEVIDEAVEATCTETGLTEGKHCSVCNEVLVKQEIIEHHPYVNGSCKICGATEGLQYTLVDGGYSVFVGEATDKTNIVIPSTYNGLPVICIGVSAFEKCSSLEKITIPNSVTNIESIAFANCSYLTNVYYQGTLEDWCNISFVGRLSNPMMGAEHFYLLNENNEYYEVTKIEIPNSITTIGYQFSGFNNLISITIPNSVTSVGEEAFLYCTSLESIIIPNSVTSIGDSAFKGCSSLESITFEEGSQLTSVGEEAFLNCTSLESIIIPNNVTSIGYSAFKGCSSLESITLPFVGNTLEGYENTHFGYIFGAYGYSYNSSYVPSCLKEVIITGGTKIDIVAFWGCSSLKSIIIPDSVTSIGSDAFNGCSSLESITISNNVISIGYYAFSGCTSLKSITIPFVGDTLDNPEITSFSWIFDIVPSSLKEVIITGGTSIGDLAFYNCSSLTNITIPNSVTSIGDSAFSGCSSLTNITIPNSVTSIGYRAFSGCSSLESIKFTDSVTSIGDSAFEGCTSLTNITIPNNVTSIRQDTFLGCSSLENVLLSINLENIDWFAFDGCSSLINIYYTGSEEQWNNIIISEFGNNPLTSATIHYNYVREE